MYGRSTPRRKTARQSLFTGALSANALLCALLSALILATALALGGCGSTDEATDPGDAVADATFPVTVTDDNGDAVTIEAPPERIVSTAPANTQMLFALQVGDRVVGVNSLDDYPPEVADIDKVGDYQVNTEAVMALSPDLVVGYSGNEEGLAPVSAAGAAVLIFNPTSVEGIYANITAIGQAVGETQRAADVVADIKSAVEILAEDAADAGEAPSVFYDLGDLYSAGAGSFVDELLTLANATNVAAADASAGAWPQFTPEQLVAADPDIVLLSGLAYPTVEQFTTDARFAGLRAVQEGKVFIVEAEFDKLVTAPGPRIAEGLSALVMILHPVVY